MITAKNQEPLGLLFVYMLFVLIYSGILYIQCILKNMQIVCDFSCLVVVWYWTIWLICPKLLALNNDMDE